MKIIIPILVGSVIGYLTNLLAIKMLFRPLEEKRIFGIKVPFTPGLIPKERSRIAKSIGEAIGDHLLTSDKITRIISSKEAKIKIEDFIKKKINKIKENKGNLKEFFESLDYKLPVESISEKIYSLLISKLNEKETGEVLSNFLKEEVYPQYKDKLVGKISKDGKGIIEGFKGSETLEGFMVRDINYKLNRLKNTDIILSDILDDSAIEKLEKIVEENEEEIMHGIRSLFYKEEIQEVILESIEGLVEQNLSKMITMFVDSKTISVKVFEVIKGYVDSKESEIAVSFVIKDVINNIMDTEVSRITRKGLNVVNKDDILSLYKFALDSVVSEENISKLTSFLVSSISENEEMVKRKIDTYLNKLIKDISNSSKIKKMIKLELERSIDIVLEMPFSILLKDLGKEEVRRVFKFVNNIIDTKFKDGLHEIIDLFDISKEVEDEINSFDIEYTEELILNIAENELKAITRLGALLGAIIGLLTPLLQMI